MPAPELHQVLFTAEGLALGDARVVRLVAHEGLSRCYEVLVDLELPGLGGDPSAWIARPALAIADRADGTVLRRFGGVVTGVRERAGTHAPQRLSVTIESPLTVLRWTTDYRIFQEMTTKDIVATLLAEAGVEQVSWRLSGTYPKREVATQFGEDTFAFVSRLLEEDGIFYFHEHADDGTTVVFGDSSSAYPATTPLAELPYAGESGLASGAAVTQMVLFERVRPTKVTLRDHDFKKPAQTLEVQASGSGALGREHYNYPGNYVDPGEGTRRARVQLDAMNSASAGARGESNAFSLTPGHTFSVISAPDAALEIEWVVREIKHVWDDPPNRESTYTNSFTLLPKDAPFRPPATVPEADVPGPQLARVTGPSGQEIHTDKYGRVKVQFPWDRRGKGDDKSSAWIRVAQMHSSGSVAIPRVGWEVVVDFEGGDPDRPIVLGRVYNAKDAPPYPLPANKTQTSLQSMSSPGGAGFNEIRMEDAGGAEQIKTYAQKDTNVVVANNKTEKVTTHATLGVGSNHKRTVGANATLDVGADEEVKVGGAQSLKVGASRTETVSGDEKIDVKGSRTMTIGGSHTTMTPRSVGTSTPASYTETVGGSVIEAAALEDGLAVAGAATISVGGAALGVCATGASSFTLGAQASTVGGAFISASGKDVGMSVGGAKATTVGGAWTANAGGDVNISSDGTLRITVGAALSFNAATIAFKVGGSNVTISGGSVVIKSSTIKLTATGPQPELAPMVEDK
jgi:type VI secretion system secreted protein VgrG